MTAASHDPNVKATQLLAELAERRPLLVAYSGGVDSTVLLALAAEALGEQVRGVIADSPSLPRKAFAEAMRLAEQIGVPVEVLETEEMANPDYASNPMNRCFFCKAELFIQMEAYANRAGYAYLAYGENADDMRQVRPGRQAAAQFQVLAPLRDAGLTKADVRFLARERGLPNWDAPAQPCLSSRIPHGIPVTTDALRRIELAEEYLRSLGFRIFRVRHVNAPGEPPAAKLEFAADELPRATQETERITGGVEAVGFQRVTLDARPYGS